MEKFRKILLCYALLLTVTGIYFDILSQQKTPYLGLLNLAFSVANFTIIGFLLHHWDQTRRWNAAIEDADPATETQTQTQPQPEPVLAAG